MQFRFWELKNYIIIAIAMIALFKMLGVFIHGIVGLILFSLLFAALVFYLLIIFNPFNKLEYELLNKVVGSSKMLTKVAVVVQKISRLNPLVIYGK